MTQNSWAKPLLPTLLLSPLLLLLTRMAEEPSCTSSPLPPPVISSLPRYPFWLPRQTKPVSLEQAKRIRLSDGKSFWRTPARHCSRQSRRRPRKWSGTLERDCSSRRLCSMLREVSVPSSPVPSQALMSRQEQSYRGSRRSPQDALCRRVYYY